MTRPEDPREDPRDEARWLRWRITLAPENAEKNAWDAVFRVSVPKKQDAKSDE